MSCPNLQWGTLRHREKTRVASASYYYSVSGPGRGLIAHRGHPSHEFPTWITNRPDQYCGILWTSPLLCETLRCIQKGKKIAVDKLRDFRYKTPGSALRGVNPWKPVQFLKVHTKAIQTRIWLFSLHIAARNFHMKMGSFTHFRRLRSLRSWSKNPPPLLLMLQRD